MNQVGVALSGASGTGNFSGTTSPTLVTPRIGTIADTSGNSALQLTANGNANYWNMSNGGALGSILLNAVGSDTDITAAISTKGTGKLVINSANTTQPIIINSGTSNLHVTTFNMANTSGTRDVTFPDASGTLLMTGQAISTVPSIAFSSTSGIIGTTTNDDAAAGSVGEYIESVIVQASATSLTTGTSKTVTSISLTAGDWDVFGCASFIGGATTNVTIFYSGINTVTNSLPATTNRHTISFTSTGVVPFATGIATCLPQATKRFSLSSTTTIYLNVASDFTISTNTAFGFIGARRVR